MTEAARARRTAPLEIDPESLLRATLESTADGILVVDRNRMIVAYNRKFLRIWDFPDDLYGTRDALEVIKHATRFLRDPVEFTRRIDDLYRNIEAESFELIELTDGRKFERFSQPLWVNQVALGRVWSFRDVTERLESEARRVAMEEELRTSRCRLEELVLERTSFLSSILEHIPDMIFVKDAKDLKFVQVNKAGEALIGHSRSALIGKSDYDFFPKSEADFFTSKDREVLASNQVLDIPEEPIHTRNLGIRSLHTKKIPIRDPEGNPKYLLGISEDITLHKQIDIEKRARLAAESARKRSDFLAEVSGAIGFSLDPRERVAALARHLVPALADWCVVMIGEDEGRIMAAAIKDPGTAEDERQLALCRLDPAASERVARAIRSRKVVVYSDLDEQLLLASGVSNPFGTRESNPFGTREEEDLKLIRKLGVRCLMVVPLIARNRVLGLMVLVCGRNPRRYGPAEIELAADIGNRGALAIDNAILHQEVRAAVRVREDFISIASHELRTPLTPLNAQLQLLERMVKKGDVSLSPEGELMRLIRMSRHDLGRLSQLVENLLDISRIGAGKLALIRQKIDVAELVRLVVERLRLECEPVRCKIRSELSQPVIGFLDPLRIEQVLNNLVVNAIKFGGGRPIDVSVTPLEGNRVAIRVSDQGVGISPKDLERIFERFERAVSERQFGGLGLGLYIARQIVQAHGGTIKVESEPGRGSTFIVEIPLGVPPG